MKTDFTYYYLITVLGRRKKAMFVPEERGIFAIHEWCLSAPALVKHTSFEDGGVNPEPLCWISTFPKIGLLWLHVFRFVKIKTNLCLMTSYQILKNWFGRFSLISRRYKKLRPLTRFLPCKEPQCWGCFFMHWPDDASSLEGPLSAQTTQPLNK